MASENEWYKAAYHQPVTQGGDTDNYWLYPTATNVAPYSDKPASLNYPANSANYYNNDGNSGNGYNDGYAVTGSTSYVSTQNYLTNVGAYTQSDSFYGTFDQGGNVWEWNEAIIAGSSRGWRGGRWRDTPSIAPAILAASFRFHDDPALERLGIGFRVANVPEPSSLVMFSFLLGGGEIDMKTTGWTIKSAGVLAVLVLLFSASPSQAAVVNGGFEQWEVWESQPAGWATTYSPIGDAHVGPSPVFASEGLQSANLRAIADWLMVRNAAASLQQSFPALAGESLSLDYCLDLFEEFGWPSFATASTGGSMPVEPPYPPMPRAEMYACVDNVHLVPEPSTLVLLGISAIGLLGYTWRRLRSRMANQGQHPILSGAATQPKPRYRVLYPGTSATPASVPCESERSGPDTRRTSSLRRWSFRRWPETWQSFASVSARTSARRRNPCGLQPLHLVRHCDLQGKFPITHSPRRRNGRAARQRRLSAADSTRSKCPAP